jgi:hypothetical protein
MDELLKQLQAGQESLAPGFTLAEFLLSMVLATLLSMAISLVYRRTHGGISYSRSFVLTIIIMSVTVSFIMLIIGSNLARAFSLVGALSIVRYRNAVKDSRDISYVFLAMAVGMACGVKLYGMAVIFTVFSCGLLLLLDGISFGAQGRLERLLQFAFAQNEDYGLQRRIAAQADDARCSQPVCLVSGSRYEDLDRLRQVHDLAQGRISARPRSPCRRSAGTRRRRARHCRRAWSPRAALRPVPPARFHPEPPSRP